MNVKDIKQKLMNTCSYNDIDELVDMLYSYKENNFGNKHEIYLMLISLLVSEVNKWRIVVGMNTYFPRK